MWQTRAPLGLLDFHAMLRGGGVFTPSNSAPRLDRDTQQAVFESSSKKNIRNNLGQF